MCIGALDMTQDELISTLQHLHRSGQPLNITAAKRRYPHIVEVAFAQVPFLGWRLALQKAGINPHEASWEVLDSMRCEICGESVRQLANHVALKHKTKWNDYLEAHPGAEPSPESVRAMSLAKLETKLPHWEPVISPEYALDRLRGWHDAGYEVNMGNISKIDGSLANQLRRFFCGLSHDELLRKVGLDPTSVRQRINPDQINRKWVIESIRDRYARGLPLSTGAVSAGEFHNAPLIFHALKLFPSWEAAVCAADLEPSEVGVKGRYRYDTKEKVLTEITRRRSAGLHINHGAIASEDPALATGAYRTLGSWNQALAALGLTANDVRPQQVKLPKTGKEILSALPAPGRLLAFVDDGGTPEKPLADLAGNFHLLCAVLISSENYLKLKAALADKPRQLPRGLHEFHATQIVNPGSSAWQRHSTRQRLDTLALLYELLLQYADQILFGFVSGEQFDAEMRAQLPAELSGIKSKEALKKVFFNCLIPYLKTRSSDSAILMDSDRETENQLRIQAVADPTGLYQSGVLHVDSRWELGIQLADLAAYTFNRLFHVKSRAQKGKLGPFDELIVDTMQKLQPLFCNVLDLPDCSPVADPASVA